MNSNRLRPEIRKLVGLMPRIPWHIPSLLSLSRTMYNLGARTKLEKGVRSSKTKIQNLEITIFSPINKQPKGAILWIFGGGHLAGYPAHLNGIASKVVNQLGVEVIAPKYRLAPKHPFPADINDCFETWQWMISNLEDRGITLDKLAIAGNSAGAGIAAALVQRIADTDGVQPQAQCLFYPMIDDRVAADRSLDEINHFIWNNKANLVAWRAYLKDYIPGAKNLPPYAAAARRKNLEGLPPAWIGRCELDLFYSEYENYTEGLIKARVTCETYDVEGVPHAFELLIPKSQAAKQFEQSAIDFLGKYIVI